MGPPRWTRNKAPDECGLKVLAFEIGKERRGKAQEVGFLHPDCIANADLQDSVGKIVLDGLVERHHPAVGMIAKRVFSVAMKWSTTRISQACAGRADHAKAVLKSGKRQVAGKFDIKVNGRAHDVQAGPDTPLLDVPRNGLHPHGPRCGCEWAPCPGKELP